MILNTYVENLIASYSYIFVGYMIANNMFTHYTHLVVIPISATYVYT